MKKLFYIFLLINLSCSSDGTTTTEDIIEPEPQNLLIYSINGVKQPETEILFYKTENKFHLGEYPNEIITFDKDKRFGFVKFQYFNAGNNTLKDFYSYFPFSSHFFNFSIEEINEKDKRVKGSFSGYIYNNPKDLNSESKYINGTFNSKYKELLPTIFDMKNTSKINGIPWIRTNYLQVPNRNPYHYDRYIQQDYSDNAYKIEIFYEVGFSLVGQYNFSTADEINKIVVSKYNVSTNTYDAFIGTGTIIFENIFSRVFKGKYTFSGYNSNNPTEVINVTDGEFKFFCRYL